MRISVASALVVTALLAACGGAPSPEHAMQVTLPTPAELQLWYGGAPAAWQSVKGTYDPALARRVLKEQNQDELIKKLEAVGAL